MTFTTDLLEVLERELVHRVDLSHAGHHKVHDGASLGHDTVFLSGKADLLLGGFRFRQSLLDDPGGHLERCGVDKKGREGWRDEPRCKGFFFK